MEHEKLSINEIVQKLKENAENIRILADMGLLSKQEIETLRKFEILEI